MIWGELWSLEHEGVLSGPRHHYFYKQGLILKVHTPGWQWGEWSLALISTIGVAVRLLRNSVQVYQWVMLDRLMSARTGRLAGRCCCTHYLLMGLCVWGGAQTCRRGIAHYLYKHNSIYKEGINVFRTITPTVWHISAYCSILANGLILHFESLSIHILWTSISFWHVDGKELHVSFGAVEIYCKTVLIFN